MSGFALSGVSQPILILFHPRDLRHLLSLLSRPNHDRLVLTAPIANGMATPSNTASLLEARWLVALLRRRVLLFVPH